MLGNWTIRFQRSLTCSCVLSQGAGTHDDALIRLVVSRSEVDMVQIKQEFQRLYSKNLESFITVRTMCNKLRYETLWAGSCMQFWFIAITVRTMCNKLRYETLWAESCMQFWFIAILIRIFLNYWEIQILRVYLLFFFPKRVG